VSPEVTARYERPRWFPRWFPPPGLYEQSGRGTDAFRHHRAYRRLAEST
jgi:hypothetical protein